MREQWLFLCLGNYFKKRASAVLIYSKGAAARTN